jgi:xanthine/uracil/vitamin C permease (AzgA family)
VRREILAGATTFVTMAYILFVNPQILGARAGRLPDDARDRRIQWDVADEAIPAFLTLTGMPFTDSITSGIGAGFLSFVVLRLLAGRIRELHPLMLSASVAFPRVLRARGMTATASSGVGSPSLGGEALAALRCQFPAIPFP